MKLAETAYFIQIPYPLFWKALQNVVLINFHEMEINHVIQILYHISKMNISELAIEPSLLSESQQSKVLKLQRTANHQLMIAYLQDQVANVLESNLDSALHDDSIIKIMLLSMIKDDSIKGMNKVMSEEQLEENV